MDGILEHIKNNWQYYMAVLAFQGFLAHQGYYFFQDWEWWVITGTSVWTRMAYKSRKKAT